MTLAVDRLSMTYSWHNINREHDKTALSNIVLTQVKRGKQWFFVDGMYSYSDINDYLHQYMDQKKHKTAEDDYNINILFVLSSYKVVIEINNNYQLDLQNTNFGKLIGFQQKLVSQTEFGSMLPNIANSIDIIHINKDAISDSIVNGNNSNTLAVIPTDNLIRSYPFSYEPKRLLYSPVSPSSISQMRFLYY